VRRFPFLCLPCLLCACGPGTVRLPSDTGQPGDLQWFWGDLHAHSGWSYDGCEEPDDACTHLPAGPGSDFYAEAAEAGLDFAALTDHAEADYYRFAADDLHPTGGTYDVWQGQELLASQADGGPVVPILGYEWTAAKDEAHGVTPGSHRTVLLADTQACGAYRIPGSWLPEDGFVPEQGDRRFIQEQAPDRTTPPELWAGLYQAALSPGCTSVRWLTFAHHSAYVVPQATDWAVASNAPLSEQVVEMYSEHGSSECRDTSKDGCGWALNDAQGYLPSGSVQAALDRGYALSFVGGTDSHDGRPGSLADGPSAVAHWAEDSESPQRQFTGGGLTGLLAPAPLGRDGIFDALQARRTIATSGPRPQLVALATGQDGTAYLPGAPIPRWNLPAGIVLVLGDLDPRGGRSWDDYGDVLVERVTDGGRVVAWGAGTAFGDRWDPPSDESWTYLRVRIAVKGPVMATDPKQGEERVWISPWFAGPADGCSTAGGRSGAALALLGLGLAWGRQRGRRPGPRGRLSARSA